MCIESRLQTTTMSGGLTILLVHILFVGLRIKCESLKHSIYHLSLLQLCSPEDLGVLGHVESGERPLMQTHIFLSIVNRHILILLKLWLLLLALDMDPFLRFTQDSLTIHRVQLPILLAKERSWLVRLCSRLKIWT